MKAQLGKRKSYKIAVLNVITLLLFYQYSVANIDSLLTVIDTTKNKKEKINAQIELSNKYRLKSLDKSIHYANLANKNALAINDTSGRARANSALGSSYYYLSDYISSIKYYEEALTLYNSINEKKGIAFTLNNIGLIYRDWNKYDQSINNLSKALDLLMELGLKKEAASCLNNIGTIYQASGDTTKAKKYYQKAYDVKKVIGDKLGMANALTNISLLLIDEEKFDTALKNFNTSLKLKLEAGDSLTIVNNYINMADVYVRQGYYHKAIEYAQKSLAKAQKSNMKNWIQNSYYVLSKSYEKLGDYHKALEYMKLTVDIRDSIYNEQGRKQINDFETRLKIKESEKEIEMLKESKKLSNTLLIVSIITIVLFIILVIVLIILYRNKKTGMENEEAKNLQISRVNKKLSDQNWLLNTQKKKLSEMYTELNTSKEQLKLSNSIKDKFFNIVAHDLREPFKELKNLSQDIYEKTDEISREEAKACAGKLKENAENLDILVNNLLQWSEAQTESIDYKPETFDLKEIIDHTLELMKPKAENKSINIISNITESMMAFGAPNMIGICFNNLLSNAIKFSNHGSEVYINFREAGHYYELEIKDFGVGISNDNLPKLFRPDMRISTQGTTKEKGSGLGLTITKEFVKLNGGRIWVESEPGKGSSFKFTVSKAIE
jgi:signal transduction histidine kinase